MNTAFKSRRAIVALGSILLCGVTIDAAQACPEGQYEACVLGACVCLPNGGEVTRAVNPLPDTLNVLGGIIKGDVNAISQGVGALVIKASCPGCAVAAQTIMDKKDKAFVETLVGRGWLVYLTTGSPTLVLADAGANAAKAYQLTHPAPNPLAPPAPAARPTKTFKAEGALCGVKSDGPSSTAGWVKAPVVIDDTGSSATYPSIDVREGDILIVRAENKECPPVPPGQRSLNDFKMKFSYWSSITSPSETAMKYFAIGDYIEDGV